MRKIQKLFGKYPVTANCSSYFTATFVGTGAVATIFDRPITEAIFISALMGISFGIVGFVKAIDNRIESE